jgi:hypothetical protein
MTDTGRRLIKEFLVTGFASVLVVFLIFIVAEWVLFLLATPFSGLSSRLGTWIAPGLASELVGDSIVVWFEIWIAMFIFVRLIRIQMNRRERKDAEDFGYGGRRYRP